MTRDTTQRTFEPHNRMTRLTEVATDALSTHPEYQDDKCIVLLACDEGAAMQFFNYSSDMEAVHHLIAHLRIVLEEMDIPIQIVPIDQLSNQN